MKYHVRSEFSLIQHNMSALQPTLEQFVSNLVRRAVQEHIEVNLCLKCASQLVLSSNFSLSNEATYFGSQKVHTLDKILAHI